MNGRPEDVVETERFEQEKRGKLTNQEKAEELYKRMADIKVATDEGTLLSAAVLCDYAGQRGFINWLARQLDEIDAQVKS